MTQAVPFRLSGHLVGTALGALLLLSACGNTSSDGPSDDDEGLGGAADAPRVKERFVAIELPPVVSRSVTQDDDGIFEWGSMTNIDGAETCAVERREAYAIFEEYEAIDPPICAISGANQAPVLEVPANSDLTITVSKDGYLPAAFTHRVESTDVFRSKEVASLRTVLLSEAQGELLGPIDPADEEAGLLVMEFSMFLRTGPSSEEAGRFFSMNTHLFQMAERVEVQLDAEGGGFSKHFDPTETQIFEALPAGLYRAQMSHPSAFCEPLGGPFSYTPGGLSTDKAEELELRVRPGHVTTLEGLCHCMPPSEAHVLIDAAQCLFEEP